MTERIREITVALCPRCEANFYTIFTPFMPDCTSALMKTRRLPDFPAISRVDNQTLICSLCGLDEATKARSANMESIGDWPVVKKPLKAHTATGSWEA